MKKFGLKLTLLFLLMMSIFFASIGSSAYAGKTKNLVIITLDGLRWQEVFGGLDEKNVATPKFTPNPKSMNEHFASTPSETSRERIFPFLWNILAQQGQLYGNRKLASFVNVSNPYNISYPGYNELFTGFPDPLINSNDALSNPNENVFEFINQQPNFHNKIAIFGTWNTTSYILNRTRSHLFINVDRDPFTFDSPHRSVLNEMEQLSTRPLGVRQDVITYLAAKEYLKAKHPRVLYLSFVETDVAAHQGRYDLYIESAHKTDAMIEDLWNQLQHMDEYRGTTTLVITSDHGRGGLGSPKWIDHGASIKESSEIWMAFLGPDTPMRGEVHGGPVLFQKQIAPTLTQFLGLKFKSKHPLPTPIDSAFK